MPIGLVINKETGGSAVGDTNPLPVKLNDGTRTVDITTSGAVGTYDGLVLYGRDVNGTYFPLPLTAGGGTMITIAGQGGGTLGSEILANQGTAGADPWMVTGTVVASGVTVTGGTEVKLLSGTNTVGSVVVASLPSVTIGTALPPSNALIGTVSLGAGGTVAVTIPSVTIGTALPASNAVIGTVTVGNPFSGTVSVSNQVQLAAGTNGAGSVVVSSLPSVTIGTAVPAGNATIGSVTINAGGTVAVTLPSITVGTALPASNAVIGTVTVGANVSQQLAAGTNSVGSVVVSSLPSVTIGTALPAGNATIGTVAIGAVSGTVAVTTGSFYQLNQLIPQSFDNGTLSYTGDDITSVIYKSGTTTVATLTLGYSGGSLITFART